MNSPTALSLEQFVDGLKTVAEEPSAPPWQGARQYGARAVKPISDLLGSAETEVARNARRALYDIVRHSSRPGAEKERAAVQESLLPLLQHPQEAIRRHALWMLSEIADARGVPAMASLLNDQAVRDDARCALLRVPGKQSTKALQDALRSGPEDFKFALADALRQRGVKVNGYPSRKLVPERQTTVVPVNKPA